MAASAPLPEARQVRLSDGPLDYTLRRSRRARRLRVVVDPAQGVVVTIPARGAIRHVEEFLREREEWVRRHVRAQARQRAGLAARRPFGPNGRLLFRGELHRLRVDHAARGARKSRVLRVSGESGEEILLLMAAGDRRTPAAVLETWLREQAASEIDVEIALHASALGVKPVAVTIRDQKTRWGSASRKGRLSFSWRLILAPPAAMETVVVHELAHLRVFGHGPGFWSIVASRRPDHREWRKWLHDHSLELHSALDDAGALGGYSGAPQQLTLADVLA
jgi:predicted metal-dependent hydrolase